MALVGGTSRQAVLEELFILVHQVVQLAVLRRQGVQLVDVELAELFNVYGPALFVGLVVELGVVFVDFGLFGVVEAVAAVSAPVHPLNWYSIPSRCCSIQWRHSRALSL